MLSPPSLFQRYRPHIPPHCIIKPLSLPLLPEVPLEESSEDDGDGLAPAGRGLMVRALEGGQGWLGAGSAIYNRAVERLNTAAAIGEMYTRSVMLMKD